MLQRNRKSFRRAAQNDASFYGEELSFAAAEAYKRLRANIDFSLPVDEKKCRIIGVTSSLSGEGKSTTSINLAFTMAQSSKNVLLMEGDLRLPTISQRLGLKANPGLSNLLAGQCTLTETLQKTNLAPNIRFISAGTLPPNPTELIGSDRMEKTLATLAQVFDVIIIDLPPVVSVSDTLAVAKYLDGVLLVVRQDYCDLGSLHETVKQLEFSKAKVLGFVMTDAKSHKSPYRKYSKDYSRYGYSK